jgi:group I intron endonuclease
MIIYYIKNKINGKGYVGQHCGNSDSRWKQHLREALQLENQKPLYSAIRKYGIENFTYQELETVPIEMGQKALDIAEISWIHKKNTYIGNKKGYNLTLGGGGGVREFCSSKGEGKAKYKWGQYSKDGILLKDFNTPTQAATILGCNNYRHLYHAANWHEGKGQFGKTFCGFMWKKVLMSEELPKKITPLLELGTEKPLKIKKTKIPNSSTSNEFEIGQYDFLGNLINTWPNNAEVIGRTLNMEGDAIRRNLRDESVLTYGFMWKRFEKGKTPKKISAPGLLKDSFTIDPNLFYDEPIMKIDVSDGDILNKYESISSIPIPFMKQIPIYLEALENYNIDGDNFHWVFEKDFKKIQIIP